MNKNTQLKKEMLLEGLVKSLGVITSACAIANVSRTSYYSYYNDDDKFAKEVDEVGNIALDFAESQLFDLIKDKNITAIIFFLKTKGRHRGYSERIEYEKIDPENMNLVVEFVNSDGSKA
mgnify:FL=1